MFHDLDTSKHHIAAGVVTISIFDPISWCTPTCNLHLLLYYFSIASAMCGASKTNTVKWLFIDSWDKQVAAVGRQPAGSESSTESVTWNTNLPENSEPWIFECWTNRTLGLCSKIELQTLFFSSLGTFQLFVMYNNLSKHCGLLTSYNVLISFVPKKPSTDHNILIGFVPKI